MERRSHPLPSVSAHAIQALELAALARPGQVDPAQASPPLVIDTRPHHRFHQGHVPGSHHIPAARLLSSEPPDGDLILITETSSQSEELIDKLHDAGYHRRLLFLADGFSAWADLGLPVQAQPAAPGRWPWAAAGLRQTWQRLGLLLGDWQRMPPPSEAERFLTPLSNAPGLQR